MKHLIAPSILAADFAKLGEEVQAVEKAGADWIHVDVMDGHFVPNLTIGPAVIKALRDCSQLPFDVHLMIERPELSIQQYVDAGADLVTVHAEVSPHLHRTLTQIRESGAKAGVAINPSTPVTAVAHVLQLCDLVLVMSVNPGFGGQSFIDDAVAKVTALSGFTNAHQLATQIQVDGGVDETTVGAIAEAGAAVLVAGSAIFGTPDYAGNIASIRNAARAAAPDDGPSQEV